MSFTATRANAAARLKAAQELHTVVHHGNQTYRVERLMILPSTVVDAAQRVRATAKVNAYANQSAVTAELWTPTGWVEATRYWGEDFHADMVSVYAKDADDDLKIARTENILDQIILETILIVSGEQPEVGAF